MKKKTRLRQLLGEPGVIVVPGAYDGISARVIEDAGFRTLGITGWGVAGSRCLPDIGLMTMTEVLDQTRCIVDSVDIPVIADIDTGYGNAINLMRTVKEFERIGVDGFFFEDQETPKKCGKYEGIELISQEAMVKKIEAVLDARIDPDLIIIARVMARPMAGLEEMIKRGQAYAKAGADVVMVRGMESVEELKKTAESIDCPLMMNWPKLQGKTFDDIKPFPGIKTVEDLGRIGYKLVFFPSDIMRTAVKAMMEAAAVLKREGSLESCIDRLLEFGKKESLIGTQKYLELESKYVL